MSECGVCIGNSYDGYEGNDFDCGPLTSKKDESCCECHKIIPAGIQYESASWNDEDGNECSAETCFVCAEIAWAFSCEARVYFNLWEDLEECVFGDFSLACLEKLKTLEAKTEIQSRWMKWKGITS